MDEATRILIVEDVAADAELAEREITSNLEPCQFQVVETEKGFIDALETFRPDIIVSDYSLPSFDGMTALKITQDRTPITPLIILTGSQNEDIAVGCIKSGAADYVLKDAIKRLGPAVVAALEVKRVRLEKERAEEAIKQSEQRYRELVENIGDIVYVVDGRGNIIFLNDAAERFFGYSLKDTLGRSFLDFLVTDSFETASAVFKRQLAKEDVGVFELDFYDKQGNIRTLEAREKLVWRDGRVVEIHGIGRDVTDEKQAEAALRESEERYRELTEHAPVGIAVQSEGKIVFTNPAGAAIIGAGSPEEVLGRDIADIIHPEQLGEAKERINRMMKGEQGIYPAENVYLKLDGTPVPVDVIATSITYGGKPAVQVIVTDVSKRREDEQAIRESEERYRELVESIDDIMYVTDGKGRILFLNNALERLTGYSRDELIGINYMDLLTPESLKMVRELFKKQKKGNDIGLFEISLVDKDGKVKVVEAQEQMIWEGDRIVQMRGIGRDITDRKRAEERIVRLNRVLESIRNIDQLIVRVKDRETLLTGACEILCEVSGYLFVWVGLIREEDKRVVPAAHWGYEDGYLKSVRITWDDTETGRGPVGTAVRTRNACVFNDISKDHNPVPWRDEALKRGYRSLMAVPVMMGKRVYGGMGVYSDQIDVFDDEEVTLLTEMAEDIAFALSAMEAEAERERTEAAMKESERKFRDFFETSRDIVYITSYDGEILDINSAFEEILGYTREETLAMNVTSLYKDPKDNSILTCS